MKKKIVGRYKYENNEFTPDKNILEINKKLKAMKLLAGSTEKTGGSFYFDPILKEGNVGKETRASRNDRPAFPHSQQRH